MQYKCDECNDAGSRDKSGDYLDCGHCDAAMQRKALNDWLASQYHQGAIAKVDSMDAWLIHQRALAMVPKQEADHINDVVKMVAPAGWKLVPEDPTGDMFRAAAKIDNEMFAGGSSHGAEDGQVWAAMYDAAPEAPIAAPSAANGEMPELPEDAAGSCEVITGHETIRGMQADIVEYHPAYSADQMRAYGKACAAAGPDAALVDAKSLVDIATAVMSQHGLIDHLSEVKTQAFCDDLRAALSGAKGNA